MSKIILLITFVSTASFAAGVKVTSFKFLDHGSHFTPGAELCGEVTQPTGKPEMIKIVSDPGSKSPGSYYAWAGTDGKFCTLIATYTGKAEADLEK